MKNHKPTTMIAYASMMPHTEELQLNKEREELSLSCEKKYFYDETLQIPIDNIESFTRSHCCSLFYFLTKDGSLHLYEMESKRVEKNIFKIEVEDENKIIDKIIDIVQWENSLFVLIQIIDKDTVIPKTSIQAYSMITWQRLWEKPITIAEELKALALDKERHLYLLTSDKKIFKTNYNIESQFTKLLDLDTDALSLSIKEPYLYVIEASQISVYNLHTHEKHEDLTIDLSQFVQTYNREINNIEKIIYNNDNLWVLDKSGVLSFINQKNVYEKQKSFSYVFNSTHVGCHWHTMQLSFTLPEKGGLIKFEIRAYDNENDKGAFETFENQANIYFENIIGQCLEVKVTLLSDPQHSSSPLFHSMKVFFPKKTYLEYLPAVYQEDEPSKLLLERYLSVFQTISRTIEEKIETSHLNIDPQTAPTEFLEWLSLWVGLHKKQYWSDDKWRILLSRSSYFFKKRGTREGLMEIMKLYTDEEPMIMEASQWHCPGKEQASKVGIYSFCVLFTPKQLKNREDLRRVQEIVDFWKPAHTRGKVSILSEKMRLGNGTSNLIFLGKNSYLGKEDPFILGEAILPLGTRVADREDSIQIQSHSRIGMDTYIKY